MAKISANGDRPNVTYAKSGDSSYKIILTVNGRLLRKMCKHCGYNVIGRNVTVEQADEYAARMGCSRV